MRIVVGFVVASLFTASGALAQPRDLRTADELFRDGRALMKAGELGAACQKLKESFRLDPAIGAAANLGDCFEKQGKVGSALLAYRAARKLLKAGDPRFAPVTQQIVALEERVPRITITLAIDAPEGTTVTRNGKRVDFLDLGKPIEVNPGALVIEVTAPGRERLRTRISLDEREARHFVAEVGEPVTAGATSSAAPPRKAAGAFRAAEADSTPDSRTAGYVLGTIGLLGMVVAIPSYVYISGKASDARNNDASAKEDGKRLQPVFYAATGIAIVGLGLGSYLVLSASDDSRTALALSGSRAGASATLTGRF